MTGKQLGTADYPLIEKRRDQVKGARGLGIDEIKIEGVLSGNVQMDDLRITSVALRQQAEIAEASGRPTLADNFRRAAELATVPQEVIMEVYELLRPGRSLNRQPLLDAAQRLRSLYAAERMAAFLEEAAEVYERRGLFKFRY